MIQMTIPNFKQKTKGRILRGAEMGSERDVDTEFLIGAQIYSQSVLALIELEGMKTANLAAQIKGEDLVFVAADFEELSETLSDSIAVLFGDMDDEVSH